MGMDVYGNNPTTEQGAYFRNNVWWWRPLAEYVVVTAPKELTAKCTHWHSNDGDGLDAEDSAKLAAFLRSEVSSGRTKEYADEWEAERLSLPRQTCSVCGGTGVRSDDLGVAHGHTTKVVNGKPENPRNGQVGWCNGCDGWGTQENWESHYPFSVENVEEFCTFLEGSGGFRIN